LKFSNSNYGYFGYFNIDDSYGNLYYLATGDSSNTQLTFSSESKE
jgi:hypothetical protein